MFISDKIVISKNDMHVGKYYLIEGLFQAEFAIEINKVEASSYLL